MKILKHQRVDLKTEAGMRVMEEDFPLYKLASKGKEKSRE